MYKNFAYLSFLLSLSLCISQCKPKQCKIDETSLAYQDSLQTLKLSKQVASGFAQLALKCIQKEYPNKPDNVMNNKDEVQAPSEQHPAFYGCFDWHSSIHGHWMLVRLLKIFPDLPEAATIRKTLNENLSAKNILTETTYLEQANRKSFERTYGWAWLLKLAEEMHGWDDMDGKIWSKNLKPLEIAITDRYMAFLPKQTYAIRTGVHPNTAFGIIFALDYSRKTGNREMEKLLTERSLNYYSKDKNCPAAWEPGGEDFLSPCLVEADLMRRILKPAEFRAWFHEFLPELSNEEALSLLNPAIITDRSDPKLVHLDGLNLSRAWCMKGIAMSLPNDDHVRNILIKSEFNHAKNALAHVATGQYEGEHWLASFAVYFLSAN